MEDPTYTTADILAEAAYQHHVLTEDADFAAVVQRMRSEEIPSTASDDCTAGDAPMWGDLAPHHFQAAAKAVHAFISSAPDISAWAIELTTQRLHPDAVCVLTGQDRKPVAAFLIATRSGQLLSGQAQARIADILCNDLKS